MSPGACPARPLPGAPEFSVVVHENPTFTAWAVVVPGPGGARMVADLDVEWLIVEGERPVWYVGFLQVAVPYRNRGVGSALMRLAIEHCRKRPAPLTLSMAPDDGKEEDLLRFYERLGFRSKKPGSWHLVLDLKARKERA